ncbi:MAG: 5-(carboxyamino)imidazole ribonucleotide mutase [Bacteroidales bacterium]|nr:5-(carboxyamino)imidazole ribonucleotide mutase [Bacteroidales bacterium]
MISIIIGSISDFDIIKKAIDLLEDFNVEYDVQILSAHRTPDETAKYVKEATEKGTKVFIAAAGLSAHLPGVVAANTIVPVIGIPINTSLQGIDSLLSIVQMPSGIAVATVGINAAQNAALLAIEILAINDVKLKQKLIDYKKKMKEKIAKDQKELEKKLSK